MYKKPPVNEKEEIYLQTLSQFYRLGLDDQILLTRSSYISYKKPYATYLKSFVNLVFFKTSIRFKKALRKRPLNICSLDYNNLEFYPQYFNAVKFLKIACFMFLIRYFKLINVMHLKRNCSFFRLYLIHCFLFILLSWNKLILNLLKNILRL